MKKYLVLFMLVIVFVSSCKKYSKYEDMAFTEKEPRDWESPELTGLNRVNPHTTMISYTDEQSALASIKENTPNYVSMDGKKGISLTFTVAIMKRLCGK